eukprot:c23728_g1_i1 orf=197-838(+)
MAHALATSVRLSGMLVRNSVTRMFAAQPAGRGNDGHVVLKSMTASTVFVGGMAATTNEDTLRESFSAFGEITDVKVIMDRATGNSRGFGYVSFSSSSEADACMKGMEGQILDSRMIKVEHTPTRQPTSTTNTSGGRRGMGGDGGGGDYQRSYVSERPSYAQRDSNYQRDDYPRRDSNYSQRDSNYGQDNYRNRPGYSPRYPGSSQSGSGHADD